jgi:hypothetical protein
MYSRLPSCCHDVMPPSLCYYHVTFHLRSLIFFAANLRKTRYNEEERKGTGEVLKVVTRCKVEGGRCHGEVRKDSRICRKLSRGGFVGMDGVWGGINWSNGRILGSEVHGLSRRVPGLGDAKDVWKGSRGGYGRVRGLGSA